MANESLRKRLERIGRSCARSVHHQEPYELVVGSLPRNGFPRGSKIRNREDGQLERLYDSAKLLMAIQMWFARNPQKYK